MWEVIEYDTEIHVVPLDDLCDHLMQSISCSCTPRMEIEPDDRIPRIIHNSFDGREYVENGSVDGKIAIFE